jgi:hypothetical protein
MGFAMYLTAGVDFAKIKNRLRTVPNAFAFRSALTPPPLVISRRRLASAWRSRRA